MVDNQKGGSEAESSENENQDPEVPSRSTHTRPHSDEPEEEKNAPNNVTSERFKRVAAIWTRVRPLIVTANIWMTALATIVIACATIKYTNYAKKQWQEMNASGKQTDRLICLYQQQLEQLKRQAGDTHSLAAATSTELEIASNAELLVRPTFNRDPYDLEIVLINPGRAYITDITGVVEISVLSIPDASVRGIPRKLPFSSRNITAKTPETEGSDTWENQVSKPQGEIAGAADWKLVMEGKEAIKAEIIALTYNNGFRSIHDSDLCTSLWGFPKRAFPTSYINEHPCTNLRKSMVEEQELHLKNCQKEGDCKAN